MSFKNELERQCFEIAQRALGGGVSTEHNKTVQIENALFPEVASFKGPPAKEVDILVLQLQDEPKVTLLVSCKQLSRRAEPAHVQEWCAVVQTMNRYSDGTLYFGLIVSARGFTSGCEAWATSHNVGIIPPLKGRQLAFSEVTVLRMFERLLTALRARVRLRVDDLQDPPAFFEFVYRLAGDFEGHEEAADARYRLLPQGWSSSFGEMYSAIGARTIEDLQVVEGATVAILSGGVILRFDGERVSFGQGAQCQLPRATAAQCRKNIETEPCTLEFVKSVAVGKAITSAGDFGHCLEVGLDQRFNLGLHQAGFHIVSTQTEEPRL